MSAVLGDLQRTAHAYDQNADTGLTVSNALSHSPSVVYMMIHRNRIDLELMNATFEQAGSEQVRGEKGASILCLSKRERLGGVTLAACV
jgi:hypothetical protein